MSSTTLELDASELIQDIAPEEAARFYSVFGGHIFFQTLRAAAAFDLFTLLSNNGPMTRSQIASALGVEEQPTRVLLLPLTVSGILEKQGDTYTNSRLAEQLLVAGSPHSVLAYIELQHRVMYRGLTRLYESLAENRNAGLDEFEGDEPTLYQRLAHDPSTEEVFQDAMQELSLQSNRCLANGVDFSGVRHVVDVGGGDGTNAIALASRWPDLRVTVFDSPTVCKIAEQNIREKGLSSRISTHSGDCFRSDFPTDADCFLFSHFFTIWSPQKDRFLLQKAFDALPEGGRVVLFNMMQEDDESSSWAAAVGSPYFQAIATGEGMLYTWSEYEEWMGSVGFTGIERLRLPRDHGAISGVKDSVVQRS